MTKKVKRMETLKQGKPKERNGQKQSQIWMNQKLGPIHKFSPAQDTKSLRSKRPLFGSNRPTGAKVGVPSAPKRPGPKTRNCLMHLRVHQAQFPRVRIFNYNSLMMEGAPKTHGTQIR